MAEISSFCAFAIPMKLLIQYLVDRNCMTLCLRQFDIVVLSTSSVMSNFCRD